MCRQPGWFVITLTLVVIGVVSSSATATEFRSGDDATVPAGETVSGDLYLAGDAVVIEGNVTGDVVAAGRTITVRGTIGGDLMAAGQTLTIEGEVGDDARIAGAVLELGESARVGGDVIASGYAFEAAPGTRIEESLTFGGRQAVLKGEIVGDALVGTYGLELQGNVGGNVEAAVASEEDGFVLPPAAFGLPPVPTVPGGLRLSEGARIGGDLSLTAPTGTEVRSSAVAGEVTTNVEATSNRPRSLLLNLLSRYLALAVVGFLLVWLAPALLGRPAGRLRAKPLPSLGWGALVFIGFPLALLVLFGVVILVAILLGLITLGDLAGLVGVAGSALVLLLALLFGLALAYLTQVVVGYAGGRWLLGRLDASLAENRVLPLLLGILVVVLLSALPFAGGFVTLAVTLLGLGSLWLAWRERTRQGALARL